MAESPFRVERTPNGRRFSFDVRAERTVRQQKRATFGRFEILCDEGPGLGDDTAPPPLAYFSAALAF